MSERDPVVFVVDDDPSVRDATRRLISSVGLAVMTFGTATEFMRAARPDAPGCLVLDVRLPDASGLDLQREISASSHPIPIIMITGHADVPMSVQAMKAGAVEFLTKPYRDQVLLDAIQHAIEVDRVERRQRAELLDLRQRFELLTRRERDVMTRVVNGLLNKAIAAELHVSEITIKVRRSHVMKKMQATSLLDLARIAQRLGISASLV